MLSLRSRRTRRIASFASFTSLVALLSLALATEPRAHGGRWFGGPGIVPPGTGSMPTNPGGPPTVQPFGGAPTPGGSSVPTAGPKKTAPGAGWGPTPPGIDLSVPEDAWDHWWYANRARYLDLQAHRRAVEFASASELDNVVSAASDPLLRAQIGARLHRVLDEGANASVDERSAALITAGKLAWQPAETRALFMHHLRSPVQGPRETAALSLGLLPIL